VPAVIGLDFDNTIVSYDTVFRSLAKEMLDAPELSTRIEVRDHLHRTGQEGLWLRIQRLAYGTRISEANAFPGVEEFLADCRTEGIAVRIISHKSAGSHEDDGIDLRASAFSWLEENGFFEGAMRLARSDVHFEQTRAAKLERIESTGCTHFIDDLVEVLVDPSFPGSVARILFDPGRQHGAASGLAVAHSWQEVGPLISARRVGQ
jgi:hypothetical protein